jgi:feruloyl esterase
MRTTVPLTAGALIVLLAAPALADDVPVTKVAATECAALAALRLPDVTISAATAVPAADQGRVRVPHCKVAGVIGTEIRFDVLLPDTWNRRFAMGGGGGFVGSVQNFAVEVVNRGYATAGTDTGHQAPGIQAEWALDHLERQVNYGYLGVHRTAEVAKAIVRAYYGADAAYDYFLGCSNGGRQALMEAQRFPADFDGIVSGAPAYDFTRIAASFITHAQATFPDPGNLKTSTVSPGDLALIAATVLDGCDIADGVRDSVIDQPASCRFSLDRVKACPNDIAAADCLTATSRAAVARIYAPIVGPSGEIYPGQPVGGEADADGWQGWITGVNPGLLAGTGGKAPSARFGFGTEFFKYFVFGDPSWDYRRFDLATWAADTRVAATVLNADSVDLSAFKQRKGKLLIWHGWSDPALNAQSTINYYERLQVADPQTPDYARLFLMPGVLHCYGGAGPDSVEWIDVIADWTEKGAAPDRVVATKRSADGAATRTRPLCRHPQRAVYNGTGSTDDAASFTCR